MKFFKHLYLLIHFVSFLMIKMLHLSITKIENIFQVAHKFYKHSQEDNYDLLTEVMITDCDSGKADEAVISEKISLRLGYAIPSYLQFNHLLLLSIIFVETNKCSCAGICQECDISKILKCGELSHTAPWGRIIGPGMTLRMHSVLSSLSPLFKLHAVFHDAYGHLYRTRRKSPGYNYVINISFLPNYFWLGYLTGLFFFFILRITNSQSFRYFVSALK